MSAAFVFPGQGSQKRGMGADLFVRVQQFGKVERDADALLGYSVRELCNAGPEELLKQTQYTQVCLYVVNALHYYDAIANGARPSFLAGHSLGEYNALLASGAFDFLTGLALVKKRGELMAAAAGGGMAAVVGIPGARIATILRENGLTGLDVANYNAPAQTVVSGSLTDINRAKGVFESHGAQLYLPLQVSAAFHSHYMAPAASTFGSFLQNYSFARLNIPVIANVTGQPYPAGCSDEQIRTLLTRQITSSVQWVSGIRYVIQQGVREFKELGPGTVLTRLIQQIQQDRSG